MKTRLEIKLLTKNEDAETVDLRYCKEWATTSVSWPRLLTKFLNVLYQAAYSGDTLDEINAMVDDELASIENLRR